MVEILHALSVSGQGGYFSPLNSDACVGYSGVGYRRSDMAVATRDAGRRVLVRLMGQAARGRSGARKELAQRATFGY